MSVAIEAESRKPLVFGLNATVRSLESTSEESLYPGYKFRVSNAESELAARDEDERPDVIAKLIPATEKFPMSSRALL
jgi:hypothetical protein